MECLYLVYLKVLKRIYTTTWISAVVQTQANTLIHSNILCNALPLGGRLHPMGYGDPLAPLCDPY